MRTGEPRQQERGQTAAAAAATTPPGSVASGGNGRREGEEEGVGLGDKGGVTGEEGAGGGLFIGSAVFYL